MWIPWVWPNWWTDTDRYDKWTADQIEKWRVSVFGENTKIYLAGHSTGSYMCSVYALYYPEKLEYLILCSPVCLLTKQEFLKESGQSSIDLKSYNFGTTFLSRYCWNYMTFPDMVRALGIFGPSIFINGKKKTQMNQQRYGDLDKNLCNEMRDLWFEYIYHIHAQPKSYEDLLFAYMKPWCWPRNPILDRLVDKLQCHLLLLYADDEPKLSDPWGGRKLVKKLKEKKGWEYKVDMEMISDSSHQMFLNQPVKSCKAILLHTHDLKEMRMES